MNKVLITGNICKDIELKKTQSGKSVVSNSVAVSREYKDASGNYGTDFINIVVWGTSAEYLSKYGSKGARVEIVGRWENRTYENKDKQNVTVSECIVESIKVFKKEAAKEEPAKNTEQSELQDDLPF